MDECAAGTGSFTLEGEDSDLPSCDYKGKFNCHRSCHNLGIRKPGGGPQNCLIGNPKREAAKHREGEWTPI